ncbi:hypothetical protein [Vibrio barjaei]|uniref:hypothetical protein n=1 Tax=Vibrio barjaei TaxID=1676683 RepID=UPI0022847661|nr:hypothetical protein [Vibrio barjaei]MCY9874784.1 hypothetical protein [Vibrio barjaei]
MTFAEQYNQLISNITATLVELSSDPAHTETVPDYSVKGLNIEKYELLGDGEIVSHISGDTAYNAQGYQFQLYGLVEDNTETFCQIIDELQKAE